MLEAIERALARQDEAARRRELERLAGEWTGPDPEVEQRLATRARDPEAWRGASRGHDDRDFDWYQAAKAAKAALEETTR